MASTSLPSPRRPRVVHVYKDVWPPVEGGIERIIYELARRTCEAFDVEIITASRSIQGHRRELLPGVTVTEVPSLGRALSSPLAPGFITALRRSRADLFHFHIPHPTGEVAYLLSLLRTPAVATYHSDVVRQEWAMKVYGFFFERFLARMHTIMPTSQRYLETSPWLAGHADRARVVALGYPLEDYEPNSAALHRIEALRREYGDFVLFLGCLRAYKGLPYLIRAIRRVPGNVPLLIAGEGAMREELEALVAELGIGERVHFLGRVSHEEAVALLHAAAVFVLPSHQRSEAFGLCQIEAMTCGTPVISTDLPTGVPEVNADGESGFIVPPGDSDAMARAIVDLIYDPAERRRLGAGARQRAKRLYHADHMAEQVAGVYREALAGKGRS